MAILQTALSSTAQGPQGNPCSPDLELARRCVDGDAAAVETLYETHRVAVHRMVRLHASGPGTVDDLVHDTFVRALERLQRYRGDAPLSVWLRGIALNLARTERARTRRRSGLLRRAVAPSASDPTPQAESRSALRQLLVLMERLPEPEREAFALRSVQQLPLEEAAALSGCSVSTLSDRDRRAHTKLHRWIEEENR